MTTVVNNPGGTTDNGSGMSMMVGIILLIAVVFMFLYFGLPLLRGAASSGGTQVNIPDKVNVNVNPGGQGGGQPAQPGK